jgi:Ca-activated chloride channel family protein
VRFSKSKTEIEAGINKPVMTQVTAQIATETSEKAVALRDKGDIGGARQLLQDNASFIKRAYEQYGSGAAAAPTASIKSLNELERQNKEAANNLDEENWNRTRKALRYDQHKAKVQQAY